MNNHTWATADSLDDVILGSVLAWKALVEKTYRLPDPESMDRSKFYRFSTVAGWNNLGEPPPFEDEVKTLDFIVRRYCLPNGSKIDLWVQEK